jgi:hypothetical protein
MENHSPRPKPESRKTVEDAVEWHKNKYGTTDWAMEEWTTIWCSKDGRFGWGDIVTKQTICTREQFEAYGREQEAKQEGEKWTHEYGSASIKCKVLAIDGDESWVFTEYGNKVTEFTDSLRPIKPTITKAEHEFLCKFAADVNNIQVVAEVESYLANHDIVK